MSYTAWILALYGAAASFLLLVQARELALTRRALRQAEETQQKMATSYLRSLAAAITSITEEVVGAKKDGD